MAIIGLHLMFLHQDVSSPCGSNMRFMIFYGKDVVTVRTLLVGILVFICSPMVFIDADNWVIRTNLVTPPHIKPE